MSGSDPNNACGQPSPFGAPKYASATTPASGSTNSSYAAQATTPPVGRSLQEICAICKRAMKKGQGGAIFTAECSHAFHFDCIASNLKCGNQICLVCGRKWNNVSFQGPTPVLQHQSYLQHRFPSPPHLSIDESVVFNDDESLGAIVADKSSSIGDVVGKNPIVIKMYPEVMAVERAVSLQNFTVLIHLKAPEIADSHSTSQDSRAPVDLVTVLDISGSMIGNKLALLKQAMEFLIQNLGPSDRLSVVAFSTTSHRLFPLCKMTDAGKQKAVEAVNSLRANGGTNIAEGLRKGTKVLEDRTEKNPVSSIMLLSDGQDNIYSRSHYGQYKNTACHDFQPLLPSSAHQIPIHAFGFGADHDAALLHSVAEMSGGTFSFIEKEDVIQDAFALCIGGLLSVVVQNLRVSIKCLHPDVRLGPLKAGRYSTRLENDGRSGVIMVGDLYADEERDFLITLSVPLGDLSYETSLMNVHCDYRDPISKETSTMEGNDVTIQRPDIVKEEVVSMEVDRQKNRVRAAEAISDARAIAERGDFSDAMSILEAARNLNLKSLSAQSGDQLSATLNVELKEVQERMSSKRRYEESGRAFALSAQMSHKTQRAAGAGYAEISSSAGFGVSYGAGSSAVQLGQQCYQTKSMNKMIERSKEFSKR